MDAVSELDQDEIIVSPNPCAGWRIEFPKGNRTVPFVVVVADELSALRLASALAYGRDVRFLRE